MPYDRRNLANTVHARHPQQYETKRCEVGSKPSAWSSYLDWNWYHRWPNGDRLHGHCLNCGKTLAEVRVPIKPKRRPNDTSLGALWAAIESGE